MIIPEYLASGDKVGIVATAKKLDKDSTINGINVLKSWGLEVISGRHLFESSYQFAGTDKQRADDFQKMIDEPEIKAIFLARGGYGSTRIIDQIKFDALKSSPKWICGFSDITAIHLQLRNLGIASMHAPMPSFFHSTDQESLQWFMKLIFGEKSRFAIKHHRLNNEGEVKGRLIGGNLSIICHTIGTKSELFPKRQILFLEDVGEQLYNIDRMLVQLKRAGILASISGLIVGNFSDMKDNDDPFGADAYEIIYSHTKEYDYPKAFNFPVGHTNENYALPVGVESFLTVDNNSSTLELFN